MTRTVRDPRYGIIYANIDRRTTGAHLTCKYSDLPLGAVDASMTAGAQHFG